MRLPALAHRDFGNYQIGNFVSNVGNRMQFVAILWQVYEKTHSNAYVGALGLIRVVPLIVFGLFGGVIADHFDRRKVLLVTQLGMAVVAVGMGAITIYRVDSVWAIYGIVAAGATANAFNGPVRQAMVANLVPAKDFPNAASINGITWRLSDLIGPVLAAPLLVWAHAPLFRGLAWVYVINAVSFLAVMWAVLLLPPKPPTVTEKTRNLRDAIVAINEGFRFFRTADTVRNTMIVDFWATFFAGAEALLPGFADEVLHGGQGVYAILASATGAGALLASISTALLPTMRRQGLWVLRMVGLFGLFTILFGLSANIVVAYIFIAATGAADMVSTVLRQTIRQLSTPDHMRGRLGSIGQIFQVSGPQLGDAEAGYLAEAFRYLPAVAKHAVPASIVVGGIGSIFVSAWWMRDSALRRYDQHVELEDE
ncbi:MAG: MFS transporter [Fimbriimonadales bacterium]